MFRKSEQDKIHHVNIKRGITSHFSRMLKILQQKHVQQSDGDEFVYSNDESNNLCNALEAVFLHGLKEPVATKLSSYVGLANPQDTPVYLNFWAVAEKFTHKNVIDHLKSLRQISTEIGLCRAWIRLALNDGLMESYLHSVVVDVKSLKYFYHSYSYLRDHEQPGILSNYLTGLMSLTFQLSLNSSVLNDWNNSTLQLISNLGSAPPAVVRPEPETARVFSPPKITQREIREKPEPPDDPEPIVASRKSDLRPERRKEQAMFNSISDVEAMRRVTPMPQDDRVSYTPSDCSSSSHTSCPDPSGFPISSPPPSLDVKNSPHLYPRPSNSSLKFGGIGDATNTKDGENQSLATCSPPASITDDLEEDAVKELMMSPPRQRSRRVSEEDSWIISPSGGISSPLSFASPSDKWSKRSGNLGPLNQSEMIRQSRSPSPLKSGTSLAAEKFLDTQQIPPFEMDTEKSTSRVLEPGAEDISEPFDDIYDPPSTSASPIPELERDSKETSVANITKETSVANITANLPTPKLDPLEQDAILKKVLSNIDLQADRDREARDLADSWRARNAQALSVNHEVSSPRLGTSPYADDVLANKATEKNKSEALEQTLTVDNDDFSLEKSTDTVVAEDADTSVYQDSATIAADQGSREQSSAVNINVDSGRSMAGEDMEEDFESGRFGNSLGSMMGWSSEIDHKQKPKEIEAREDSSRTESFAAMLRSYIPGMSAPDPAVTLDQVIEDLPRTDGEDDDDAGYSDQDDEPDGQARKTSGESKASSAAFKQRQDSCLDDFEVLDSPSDSLCGQVAANSSRMIFLFRVPQEHGLSHQNFTCRGCSRPIGIIYGQPRLCSFDGGLYCYECHENMETYIPSSIVFDWDFRKKKVCTENFKFLTELESQALYDIEKLNPKLYSHVPELQDLKILRQRLCYLKSYLFTCSAKMAESLRQKVWPREHLYDRRDLYSVTDLLQVQAGTLQKLVKDLVRFSSQHVYSCVLCSQKGYVCEICRNARIIYAFEVDTTVRCETCKAVYHKTCMTESLPCPKCQRWGRRSNSSIMNNHPEDYGTSPVQHSEFLQHSSPSSVSLETP
ncbi:pleckstrin homology domain-containing family M member 3 [Elysia marginata]|uniref:Pleckstrin homology domain-containing family M member 3 n=1 Tax=Elysia marginata TaxID=1093978 RepID=A0AAV4I404_9GAST|nr:pleckstrin homology domain-containing family M member 3 [Elysia marginata]